MKNAVVFLAAFIVVLGAGLGAFYFTQSRAAQAAGPAGPAVSVLPPEPPAQRQFAVAIIAVGEKGKEIHRWTPGTLVVRVGDTVNLRLKNADLANPDYPHGFSLPAFGVNVPEIPAGQEKTVTFKATRAGVFDFKCAYDNCAVDHDQQTGQLIVLP